MMSSRMSSLEQELKLAEMRLAAAQIERNALNQAMRIYASKGKIDPANERQLPSMHNYAGDNPIESN